MDFLDKKFYSSLLSQKHTTLKWIIIGNILIRFKNCFNLFPHKLFMDLDTKITNGNNPSNILCGNWFL